MPSRWILALLIALLALSAVGCRLTRVAYNRAGWLILREADRTICPEPAQRALLERSLKDLLSWHRRSELPRYASTLRQLASELERPATRELLGSAIAATEQARTRLTGKAESPLLSFGMSLGPRQAACLGVKLAARQRQHLADQRLGETAYLARRRARTARALKPWIGELSSSQHDLLARLLPSPKETAAVAEARSRKNQRLISAIASSEPAKKRRWLRSWVTDPEAFYTEPERALLAQQRKRNEERVWEFLQTLSAGQRARLSRRLVEYATDFEVLARQ